MTSLSRSELIKALIKGLKLDDNILNYQSVVEEIEQIQEYQFMDFYKTVMNADTFGNGLKAIIQVAETFKPTLINETEAKAKELIALVYSMNATVFENAKTSGRTFEDELKGTKFRSLDDEIAILDQVKPYTDYKQLVSKISCYATSLEQLQVFKNAIEYAESYRGMIECNEIKGLLK